MVHVVATAFASKVFPVPGGPYSSSPERHRPSDSSSGCSKGNWIVSRISFFTSCSPPTSCQDTEGICQERENPCQHSLLSPERAWAAPVSRIHISPLLSFARENQTIIYHKNTPEKVSAMDVCSFERRESCCRKPSGCMRKVKIRIKNKKKKKRNLGLATMSDLCSGHLVPHKGETVQGLHTLQRDRT